MTDSIAQTPEAVAYQLMVALLHADGKTITMPGKGTMQSGAATRKELMDAYSEAIKLIRHS